MQKSFKRRFKRLAGIISGWAIVQWPIACIYYILIWFVYFTSRKDIEGYSILKKFSKKPAIFVFWHGRTMMLSPLISMVGVRGYALADPRKDGRAMAKLERLLG